MLAQVMGVVLADQEHTWQAISVRVSQTCNGFEATVSGAAAAARSPLVFMCCRPHVWTDIEH